MTETVTFTTQCHFATRTKGRRVAVPKDPATDSVPTGRVPRISRLMALAIRFDMLVSMGEVVDYGELAILSHVTRARITQIMNLNLLAPDIQEEIVHLPRVTEGRDALHLRQLQSIALVPEWEKQRRLWRELVQQHA